MNKAFIFLIATVALNLAFYIKPLTTHPVQNNFVRNISTLQQDLTAFEQQLSSLNKEEIITAYYQLREHFKETEFLLAYVDAELYETRINESPLLKPLKGVPQKEVHEPGGFQVLDEALFAEDFNKEFILQLTKDLNRNISFFQKRIQSIHLSDAQLLVALKLELLRSYTLGVTGFDTPGSNRAMEDLKIVNRSVINALNSLKETYASIYLEQITTLLEQTRYTTFDDFDRFGYYKEILQPVFAKMEAFRMENNVESEEKMHLAPLAYNSKFTNIFSEDFLNKSYFVHLPEAYLSEQKIELGKRLFNDKLLSKDGNVACASCHNGEKAFSDQVAKSLNDLGDTLKRNSPSLNYSIYAMQYFHDMRAQELKNQIEHVFTSDVEFNSTPLDITKRIQNHNSYPALFKQCFPDESQPVSINTLYTVLKSYLSSLPSFDSSFDKAIVGKTEKEDQEMIKGYNLFMGKAQCATCHFPPTFSGLVPPQFKDSESEVLGVLLDEDFKTPQLDEDAGRGSNGIMKEAYDFYMNSFKTPSLRNVSLSFPYMHNGSINSLEKVVEFYDLGGGAGMGLDIPHQTLPSEPLNLSTKEKKALVHFMETLTDGRYSQ